LTNEHSVKLFSLSICKLYLKSNSSITYRSLTFFLIAPFKEILF